MLSFCRLPPVVQNPPLFALFAARPIITQDALQGHNRTARHVYTQFPDICSELPTVLINRTQDVPFAFA